MASSEMTNFYEVLGVLPNATPKDINNAYKRLALKHHPDKVSGGDVDEFHKIQEAAETLRDPDRRRRHDYAIKAFRIRNYYKTYGQNLNRNRDNTHYDQQNQQNQQNQQTPQRPRHFYSKWMPPSFGSHNMGTGDYTYMYSYENSVHMSPSLRESAAERERYAHARRKDEEIRRNIFYQTEKGDEASASASVSAQELKTKLASTERLDARAWKARLQEATRARIARDEEELKNEEEENPDTGEQDDGNGVQGVVSEDESESESESEEDDVSALGSGDVYGNEEGLGSNPMPSAAGHEEHDDQKEEDQKEEGSGEIKSNLRPDSSSLFGQSEYTTAPEESDTSDDDDEDDDDGENDEPAHEDDAVFYDCFDVKPSHLSSPPEETSEETSESETSDEEDESEQAVDSKDNKNEDPTTPITPFMPHFTAKLNDPSGKYTEEDLRVELSGMMMESYCVWLEGLRLSFTNAQPASSARDNDPESCPHLGYWKKEFEVPECRTCRRWRPIYTLTCPGCGINRCVGCKFFAGKQE